MAAARRTVFLTDLEGRWDLFRRLVARSDALRLVPCRGALGGLQLEVRRDARLVYGGDLFDRGPGDLRLADLMLRARELQPERVTLIMGNRDANKMRFAAELAPAALAQDVDAVPGPYWAPDPHKRTLRAYVARFGWPQGQSRRVLQLRWMLHSTLGAADAFAFRRQELAALAGGMRADDEAVAASFLEQYAPAGALGRYLRETQLAARVGDTLFVHGCVSDASAGAVPRLGAGSVVVAVDKADSVDDWLPRINAWAQAQVDDWAARPTARGGDALVRYAQPGCAHGIVHNNFMTGPGGNPAPPGERARAFLRESGVRRVVVGHKPVGDVPATIALPGLLVVCGDTGYSGGQTLSLVTLWDDGRTTIEGTTACGREHRCELPADALVGRPHGRGSGWARSRLLDGRLVVSEAEGFKVANRWAVV